MVAVDAFTYLTCPGIWSKVNGAKGASDVRRCPATQAEKFNKGASDVSRCPAAQAEKGANLYEAWVRNSLAKRVTAAPNIGGRALRSLQLLQHVLEPMVKCTSVTSSEHFTIQEICLTQGNFFRCLQHIYPSARASLPVWCVKLICSLPWAVLEVLRSKPAWRPFFWSSWFWTASLPWCSPQLLPEAAAINTERNQDPRIATMQPLFRGCHQLVEIACRFGLDRAAAAAEEVAPAKAMMQGAQLLQAMAQVLNILAQLDVRAYQEYRPALKGTSGGDSIALRQLTRLCRGLQVTGDELQGPEGRDLLNAVHSLQYGIGLFWSAHLGLAVTSNGLDATGTAGLSIRQMFVHLESVLNSRFSQWIPRYASGCPPQSKWVNIAGATKEVGEAIFDSLECEAVPAPERSPSKESLDSEKLFDSCWSKDFRSFSMAPPLKAELVDAQQIFLDHRSRLDLGHFYSQVLPDFRIMVRELLHLDSQTAIGTSANLSESLFRLLLALAQREEPKSTEDCVVVSGSSDFLSFRALWRTLARASWKRVEVGQLDGDQASPYLEAFQRYGQSVRLVHVTAVSSVGQIAMSSEELRRILVAARGFNAVVIVDLCQAFCNIDYDFGQILGGRLGDVFLLGSCVKHGRSLEGLGFCAFDPKSSLRPWLTPGWCADLASIEFPMKDPQLCDASHAMEGGTVANAVHAELFVKQQRHLRSAGMTVKAINQHVLRLQESFLSRLGVSLEGKTIAGEVVGWTRRQNEEVSKALALHGPRADQLATTLQQKGFRCDSRHGSYLRIGFDICHTEADALALADALRQIAN